MSLVDLNDNEPKFEKLILYLSGNATMSLGGSSSPVERYLPSPLSEGLKVNTSILEVCTQLMYSYTVLMNSTFTVTTCAIE